MEDGKGNDQTDAQKHVHVLLTVTRCLDGESIMYYMMFSSMVANRKVIAVIVSPMCPLEGNL